MAEENQVLDEVIDDDGVLGDDFPEGVDDTPTTDDAGGEHIELDLDDEVPDEIPADEGDADAGPDEGAPDAEPDDEPEPAPETEPVDPVRHELNILRQAVTQLLAATQGGVPKPRGFAEAQGAAPPSPVAPPPQASFMSPEEYARQYQLDVNDPVVRNYAAMTEELSRVRAQTAEVSRHLESQRAREQETRFFADSLEQWLQAECPPAERQAARESAHLLFQRAESKRWNTNWTDEWILHKARKSASPDAAAQRDLVKRAQATTTVQKRRQNKLAAVAAAATPKRGTTSSPRYADVFEAARAAGL